MKLPPVDVAAEFACFTRPEMKVERTSYEVITPSASRNILQCILWKPAIDYQIEKIEVLAPINVLVKSNRTLFLVNFQTLLVISYH